MLYLLDGHWHFKLLASIQGGLFYDRYVPDVTIVGITYSGPNANYDSLRAVDYTPRTASSNPGSGQGAKFLSFIETELIPFVESSYPADPSRRALMGASLGGLFTLYAMVARPGLFAGYAAGSPAVTYANRGTCADEAAYAAAHRDLAAWVVDKPGVTSLAQLADVRRAVTATTRIYSIVYSERFENGATVRAGELVRSGAIGQVLQTVGHRAASHPSARPSRLVLESEAVRWHHLRHRVAPVRSVPVLHRVDDGRDRDLAGSKRAASRAPGVPGRTILGTDGYIEIRKNVDLAGRPGGNHLFVADRAGVRYIDCRGVELSYGRQLVDDVLGRTETAMTQAHWFLAAELALLAQARARVVA